MTILDELVGFCNLVAARGWHEYNGGNVSLLLDEAEVDELIRAYTVLQKQYACTVDVVNCGGRDESCPRSFPLAHRVPELAGGYLLVTASGCLMKNVATHPDRDTGLIRIHDSGEGYDIVAGFTQGKRPTSELVCHAMVHAKRLEMLYKEHIGISSADSQYVCKEELLAAHRVVYHAHTPNLIALSHMVVPLVGARLTAELWSTFTECPLFCPQGIGTVDFCVPGSLELAKASVEVAKHYQAALWAKHGILVWGSSLDDVYGLVETLEKAARIALDVRSATSSAKAGCKPSYNQFRGAAMLTKGDLKRMDEQLHLGLNPDVLDSVWE